MNTILIVEDETDIRDVLEFVFQNAGYHAVSTGRGDEALEIARGTSLDLVVLDIGLPGLSGMEILPHLTRMDIPVLILSSHDREDQVVSGLEVGADDYVTKPFSHRELLLRVDKLIRRTRGTRASRTLEVGPIAIDLDRQQATIGEQAVSLTPTEFDLIAFLARTPGVPQPTETLLREVWQVTDWVNGEEMVKVGIRRLRKKIEPDPAKPRYILNRWGQGYFLAEK